MITFANFLKTKKIFIFWVVVASILATIVALNFIPGEKKIVTRISELYAVHDPQFLHSMGNLLGPGIVSD